MPCSKITTGQPFAGFTPNEADVALGTVTSTGTCNVSVGTGTGLNRVRKRLLASSCDGFAQPIARERRGTAQVVGNTQCTEIDVRVSFQQRVGLRGP